MESLYDRCMDLFDTDEEAAAALHVTVDFFKEVVEGKRKLDPPSILIWANVLNIPVNEAGRYFK